LKNETLKNEILKDAIDKRCPAEPSDDYVRMFVFEETEIQKLILSNCHPADAQRANSLRSKVQKERESYKKHFSSGKAQCLYESGKPVIHAVSDSGTTQTILF